MPDRLTPTTAEERQMIERFLAAFNAIEHHLRTVLQPTSYLSFSAMVNLYAEKKRGWKERQMLVRFADLRNMLVHNRIEPDEYLAVPHAGVVAEIERIRDELEHPRCVLPTFQRQVQTVRHDAPLAEVLRLIKRRSFSQFPVYQKGTFCGLLTERGITRWLAHQSDTLIDISAATVEEVLAQEEARPNYTFIDRATIVEEAFNYFSANPFLEALLITHDGERNHKLLGIITRWDLFSDSR